MLPVGATLPSAENVETIDAAGCLVTPGFIDCHAHSDAYLIIEPDAPSKISQGVTTEINGQCGGSAAPRYGEARLSSDWASILGELRRRIESELAASGRDWSTVMIGGVWHPENKAFCGRFVSELTDDPARFIGSGGVFGLSVAKREKSQR